MHPVSRGPIRAPVNARPRTRREALVPASSRLDPAPRRRLAPLSPVYTGHSSDGNLQGALDQALARAQQAISDSSVISDATFSWDLTAIHGLRGGFIRLRDIDVEITVR